MLNVKWMLAARYLLLWKSITDSSWTNFTTCHVQHDVTCAVSSVSPAPSPDWPDSDSRTALVSAGSRRTPGRSGKGSWRTPRVCSSLGASLESSSGSPETTAAGDFLSFWYENDLRDQTFYASVSFYDLNHEAVSFISISYAACNPQTGGSKL